jgi:hypothetical protein
VTYLLDTNVVSYFLQAQREAELAQAAARRAMAVVEDVRIELDGDPQRGGRAFKKWFDGSRIEARTIEPGTPAHDTLAALLVPPSTTKNRGERASIALAASDPTLTFVTNDKNGMVLALREVWSPGERVQSLGVFLRRLFDHGLVDVATLDDVMKVATTKHPSWWGTWRQSITPTAVPVGTAPDGG